MRILTGAVVAAVLLLAAPTALAHQGNPHYRSEVKRVTPAVKGVTVSVLNYDDSRTSGSPSRCPARRATR